MKLIVITREDPFPEEATYIHELFRNGLEILHLRKPSLTKDAIVKLLVALPACYHPRIVLHDHYELSEAFDLKGIHLNGRNAVWKNKMKNQTSCSCHTLKEVEELRPDYEYLFLSPVFDSISKRGYQASFSALQLEEAGKTGMINKQVIALGGITAERVPMVSAWGFGGIAVIGTVWNGKDLPDVTARFKRLKTICDTL